MKDKPDMKDVLELSLERGGSISLSVGEPGFPTPKNVIEATKSSLDSGATGYSDPAGLKDLRLAISEKLKKYNNIKVGYDRVMVTCGSSEGLFLATMAVMKNGDNALIPDPGFMDYSETVRLVGGSSRFIELSREDFSIDMDLLRKSTDDRTRILFMNSPCNPTGTVMKKRDMEEIADFVNDKNIMIFSDEAYEKYLYDGEKHHSIGSLNGMEDKVVTFNTFSKTYSMPGFRIGYCSGPKNVIDKMCDIKFTTSVSLPVFLQRGSLEALKIPDSYIESTVSDFDSKRKFVVKRLGEIGFDFVDPKGAFYVFPKTLGGMSSWDFTKFLLENSGVMVVPGYIFGSSGEGYIRISYANTMENLEAAMNNIEKSLKENSIV